jgi:hypothetical protein
MHEMHVAMMLCVMCFRDDDVACSLRYCLRFAGEFSRMVRVGELNYGCVVRAALHRVTIVVVIPMKVQSSFARELAQ